MKFIPQTPKKALNKAFLKQRPLRCEIDLFKENLIRLLGKVDEIEREENQKNHIRDFLRDTFYKENNEINTKDNKDLVIHLGKSNKDTVGVIIEAKRPGNKNEMLSVDKPNVKAFHELILYYFDERDKAGNNELKHLVITNVYEWFIIDANYFDKIIYRNSKIKKLYETYICDKKDTAFFYEEISKILPQAEGEIPCTCFDIRDYEKTLKNEDKADDKNLIALFKILSPFHLLKVPFADDSNTLNSAFYKELLHLIGLEEAKENGKFIIRRKLENRNAGSLIENAMNILETEDVLHKIPDLANNGETKQERLFNISLALSLTWINRILFLKLLEGQLINYHKGEKQYRFLNIAMIKDFDELYQLFHQVLARTFADRTEAIQKKYSRVPYLNSSLFEISVLESQTIKINSLDNSVTLELISNSVLKEEKKKAGKLPALAYLFKFLDAYDFASEGTEAIQEDSKTLINASVLGKVFEKINGYKDGSIFTPAFITMYMCKQSIRLAVVEKFNEVKKWDITQFDDLYNKIENRKEANEIINSLKICDPAVGSGHFLVSALNEIIAIKSELGILMDEKNKTLRDYEIEIVNDELIITDENGTIFAYHPKSTESNRVQKTLFHEKQTIIENCLFGVDINPNSVKICQLRLWIELLKNAYYKDGKGLELETLPNIDINIKCGNSLVSRFPLDADLKPALTKSKWNIESYKLAVQAYHSAKNKDDKKKFVILINEIKGNFESVFMNTDPRRAKLSSLRGQIAVLENKKELGNLFEKLKEKDIKGNVTKLKKQLEQLEADVEGITTNATYRNEFEWRFEFPEVLNNNGDFNGFDVIVGNPPYIRHEEIKHLKPQLEKDFVVFNSSADILTYFFELGNTILKPKGILSFIVSNKFFKAGYGEKLRTYLIQNTLIQQIIEFDKLNIFDEATVRAAIIQFSKEKLSKTFTYVDVVEKPADLTKLVTERGAEYEQALFRFGQWIFQSEKHWKIYKKINKYGTPLNEWDLKINFGIKTGFNEAFLIDEKTKNRLIREDKNASKIIKPLYRGREIEKYYAHFQNTYLIAIPKGFTIKRNLPKGDFNYLAEPSPRYGTMEFSDAWEWLQIKFPSVANYLKPFKSRAKKRQDQGDFWWELRACDYYNEFEKPKLIWKRIGSKLRFCYDESGTYSLDSTCIATGKHLKYLVGVLNSTLIENELNRYAPKTGTGDLIISVQALSPLQIPIPTQKQEKQMNDLVDKIIAQKQQGKDSTENEKKMDELVYKLYNLTEEDIKIIEKH